MLMICAGSLAFLSLIIMRGRLHKVPDEQILLWEEKVSPERSQRPLRSTVGKAIPEVILEEVPECDRGTTGGIFPAGVETVRLKP